MSEQTIPVVDLGDFQSNDPKKVERFVQTMGKALVDLGFFSVINHGVDSDLIKKAYEQAEKFFLLPDAAKRSYEIMELKGQRGYTSFGREHAKDSDAPDLKEFWHVARTLTEQSKLRGVYPENLWPSELPEFRPIFEELYQQLETCSSSLLRAASIFIGEEENLLSDMATDGNSILRVIHYPPVPPHRHPSSMRAAPHEDINFITLLCESTSDGLELLQRDGVWRPIRALQGQIIVDAGDMLQNLTNGYLRSTTHRVVNPGDDRERRFSMPFFVHPRPEVDLNPLKSCVQKTGGLPQYEGFTAGEYLARRLKEIGL